MKSDIVIEGQHAAVFKKLIENNFYQSNTNIFFDALMIGLLCGEKGEPTVGDERVEITRTWLNNPQRSNFRTLISNFINLELQYEGEPLKLQDIFLDELGTNDSEKIVLMKEYAFFGIQKLSEIYFDGDSIDDDTDYLNFISNDLTRTDNIDFHQYYNEKPFDLGIEEIINEMR